MANQNNINIDEACMECQAWHQEKGFPFYPDRCEGCPIGVESHRAGVRASNGESRWAKSESLERQ